MLERRRQSEELALSILILLASALSANSPPASARPDASASDREADGSHVIRRPILAEPVSLAQATDGLVADADANEAVEFEADMPAERRRRLAEAPSTTERRIERAFEEAIDQGRSVADD
jgi:hypothetical protein